MSVRQDTEEGGTQEGKRSGGERRGIRKGAEMGKVSTCVLGRCVTNFLTTVPVGKNAP